MVVFTIFLSLLLGVAVMFGRSRLDKVAELGNTSKGRISNGVLTIPPPWTKSNECQSRRTL